jgi:pilus assembly protein Flp/PilA
MKSFARFCQDETAATAIEYAMIACGIALLIIAGSSVIGAKLASRFNAVANNLS